MGVVVRSTKRRAHYHSRICRIGEPRDVSGFCYNINPTELHVDSDIDVVKSVVYSIIRASRCILQRDISVILGPCTEALAAFHTLSGNTCLCEKSVCKRCQRRMSITVTSPKLNNTQ